MWRFETTRKKSPNPGAPDDTLQQLFLNLVDSCTSWHLALLRLFQSPEKWAMKSQIRTAIEAAGYEYPVICSPEELGGIES